MQAEAQISLDSNTQLQSETVDSVQNEDPGVSSSPANAVMPQQPGQFSNFRLYSFYLSYGWEVLFNA